MSFNDGEVITRTVPNPTYVELEELLTAVEQAKTSQGAALGSPAQLMGSGNAWRGRGAAATFEAELEGRKQDLPGYFEDLVQAIRDRMSQVPRTTTVETRVW